MVSANPSGCCGELLECEGCPDPMPRCWKLTVPPDVGFNICSTGECDAWEGEFILKLDPFFHISDPDFASGDCVFAHEHIAPIEAFCDENAAWVLFYDGNIGEWLIIATDEFGDFHEAVFFLPSCGPPITFDCNGPNTFVLGRIVAGGCGWGTFTEECDPVPGDEPAMEIFIEPVECPPDP